MQQSFEHAYPNGTACAALAGNPGLKQRVNPHRMVSRAGAGVKGEKLRQFMAINGRPVELPRAVRALNDTYK